MVTQKQINKRQEKENLNLLNTKFKLGQDFILNGEWGEIVELFPSGNILIEFPNRVRTIITKTQLEDLKWFIIKKLLKK